MKINKKIAKGYIPNVSEEVFVMKKVKKILYYGHTLSEILAMKLMLEHFIKKGCRRPTKENSGLKK